jgi:hypothetical protein
MRDYVSYFEEYSLQSIIASHNLMQATKVPVSNLDRARQADSYSRQSRVSESAPKNRT